MSNNTSLEIRTRIKHKHDTASNWANKSTFVPLAGELIIYDADETCSYPRFKIGDNTTTVSDLPFVTDNLFDYINVGLHNVGNELQLYVVTGGECMTIESFLALGNMLGDVLYSVVEEVPTSLVLSNNGTYHVAIHKKTGVAYLDVGYGVMTAGQVCNAINGTEYAWNHSWTTDPSQEKVDGFYVLSRSTIIKNVDELPSIGDVDKIYRIVKDSVELIVNGMSYLDVVNAIHGFASDDGVTPYNPYDDMKYYLVDTLPSEGESLVVGGTIPVYIVKTTGIGYIYTDLVGEGNGWKTASELLIFDYTDGGWYNDGDTQTDQTVYSRMTNIDSTYHVYDGTRWSTLVNERQLETKLDSNDISSWAKELTKPAYTLDEIDDTSGYVKMTSSERGKLSGIDEGAQVNVQSDWNSTDVNSDSFIWNKPTIPTYSSKAATSGGTEVSLVTTGEKYTWNNPTYSNDTPIVNPIGSIKEGETFTNVSIHEMLTKILYPYIDIEVGTVTVDDVATQYVIPNYPVLKTVSIYVKKNSATNLQFSLWDVTDRPGIQISETLTEADISNDTLTFSGLDLTIDTDRDFEIHYSYRGEGGEDSENWCRFVGGFTLNFTKPSTPTISLKDAQGSQISKNHYTGQTVDIEQVETTVSSLGSAEKITKVELYKKGTLVTSVTDPTLPYTFNLGVSVDQPTTYEVRAYYKERTPTSTDYYDAYVDTTYSLTFTRKPAVVSLSGISGGTYSKLDPQTIWLKSVQANFTKYSDQITSVKLLENGTPVEENSVTGHDGTAFSSTAGSTIFNFNKTSTCTNFKLKAQVYNGTVAGSTSSEVAYNFYAPYCYGFVDEDKTFEDIDASILKTLTSSQTKKTNITLTAPGSLKKFIYAVPNGSFTSAKDGSNEENFGLFEKNSSGEYNKTITFVDGTTQTYQILILKNASAAAVNLTFN